MKLIRKILHSLRKLDYDLVTSTLYEKELKTLTPNQVLNKIIAHEFCKDNKPRAQSSPTYHALQANVFCNVSTDLLKFYKQLRDIVEDQRLRVPGATWTSSQGCPRVLDQTPITERVEGSRAPDSLSSRDLGRCSPHAVRRYTSTWWRKACQKKV